MDEEKDNKRASRKNDSDNDEDNDGFRDEPEEPQPQSDDNDDDDNNNSSADEEDAKTTNKHQQVHEDDDQDEEYKHAVSEDDDDDVNNDSKNKMATNENDQNGVEDDTVVHSYNFVERYVYDQKKYLWCEITFALPLNYKKLDLTAILRDVATKSVLWQIPNINRAITYMKDDRLMLRTDGINILEMFKYHKLLDLNRLYCNDIHKMADTYGIEAAMKIIVKEVKDVFNVYGIKVDPRHLSLIADYMTFNGTFEPLSRKGMESSASPLQQITFESSLTFLKAAAIRGKRDQLSNPSSCLIVGKPSEVGTGCFSVLPKIPRF